MSHCDKILADGVYSEALADLLDAALKTIELGSVPKAITANGTFTIENN